MVTYHCPYCKATIAYRPELSGERVACSKCGGKYYEPTDPLPGMLPEKAEPPDSSPVSQPNEPTVPTPTAKATPSRSLSHANDITTCDPSDMVAEMERRGERALMITWTTGKESNAKSYLPDGLTQEDANRVILQLALNAMKQSSDAYEVLKKSLHM